MREMELARFRLQQWFDSLPIEMQKKLYSKFRNKDNNIHFAAYTELLVHQLLRNSGYALEYEPTADNGRKPDYKATDISGKDLYVEVTSINELPPLNEGARTRLMEIYDRIQSKVIVNNIAVQAIINAIPSNSISAKPIINFLSRRLRELEDSLETTPLEHRAWSFSKEGWNFSFRPFLAYNSDTKPQERLALIGYNHGNIYGFSEYDTIREAVLYKASHYGNLNKPFLLVVNCLNRFSKCESAEYALYGTPILDLAISNDPVETRKSNGAWFNVNGWQYSRLSAVLFIYDVYTGRECEAKSCLFHNPKAQYAIANSFLSLAECRFEDGSTIYTKGKQIGQLLCAQIQ